MKIVVIFLGVVVGVILFLSVVGLLLWYNIKKKAKQLGLGNLNIHDLQKIKAEESERSRSVSGMTKLLLPNIIRDFPDFNENRLYHMTEDGLRNIFRAITEKNTSFLDDVPLLKESISNMINDCKNNQIEQEYRDIKFHDFALKDYYKEDGCATIVVSTSVEYYYSKKENGKIVIDDRYKKQTRYACKFIYIYDESQFNDYEKVITANCPNCGAVIKSLGHKYCEFCGSEIKDINLKTWTFSYYDEY